MKVIIKSSLSDIGVTYRTIEFTDKALDNAEDNLVKNIIGDGNFKAKQICLRLERGC